MKLTWSIRVLVLAVYAVLCLAAPFALAAQEPGETTSGSLWSRLEDGKLSFSVRYRFEAFERDGAPFTATAYAPTMRLALGYETPSFHGFTAFAQGEAVIVTGPADYSVPALPSQNRPNLPAILDPKSLEMNQGYLKWTHSVANKKMAATVGRQELTLNDGRFLSISTWRQVHGTFDAARLETELPRRFSFTYAFINRLYRVDGYNATDGPLPMHSHLWNLVWNKRARARVALYGLLLDYHTPVQFTNSTQTYGVRATGPYQFNKNWSLIYTAEYAKQKNFGSNPNRVDANYYLGELGPGWRGLGVKAGYAFLAGHSPTDLLTTPAAPPFNGWTDLFVNNPIVGGASGLEARYLHVSGPIRFLGGAFGTVIFYDYHSDVFHVHYGRELDSALAYKVSRVSDRWEIGWRFGRYWADHLFTNAVRTSIYTSFTL
jgi:alginate export protein